MHSLLRYSYSAALFATCLILCPLLLHQTLSARTDSARPASTPETSEADVSLPHADLAAEDAADRALLESAPEGESSGTSFVQADASYWNGALFIGDSRTVGLSEYGGMDGAVFFCSTGMNGFKLFSETVDVPGIGSTDLESLLAADRYDKIYLMLGINELGDDLDNVFSQYTAVLARIRGMQPDAVLYVEGNLHVGRERSDSDVWFNNSRIDALNRSISTLADGRSVYYIDVNELFDDGEGNLPAGITFDQVHVYGRYYAQWAAWLLTKTAAGS